ncbi:MAG: hypothetical protein U0324_19535 [Polyangiales bacterium]
MRPRILEELPTFDVRALDDLGTLAYATLDAHIRHTIHTVASSGRGALR